MWAGPPAMALPCGGSLAMKSTIPRALGAQGGLFSVWHEELAGKEGKETSGLVSGNWEGFMQARGLLIQPPQRRCPSSSTLATPPPYPLKQPWARHDPGSSAALHAGWASGGHTHPVERTVL